MGKKWIQSAIDPAHKGLLHRELHIKGTTKIPLPKLESAARKGGKIGKRANLAITLRGMK